MAIQLPMTDSFGNSYPTAYSKWAYFSIDISTKTIVAIFNNYKDEATRNDPTKTFFSQTRYMVGSTAIEAKTDEQGNIISPAIPSFDEYTASDNANPQGIGAQVYGFAKSMLVGIDVQDV
jgi:hypothetical protein